VLGIAAAYVASQIKAAPLPVYGTMSDFILTNQDNKPFSLADLRGQVWIADAIFTRCPGQCLMMSGHMKEIQAALPSGLPVKFVSMTTDPAFDNPDVLQKYADRFGAQKDRWVFLTGEKAALHRAEVDGLKLSVIDKPAGDQTSPNDLFIHSEKFILLDKAGQLRGIYDGEKADTVPQIVAAAETLARE
jgi:protein SCO1/2